MKKLRFNKKQKKQLKQLRSLGTLLFIFVMLLGFVVGLMFFFRPDKSVSEKRLLTEFPEFTISSFLDGSFFSQVSLWFSDTYPGRDTLIAADQGLKSVYGIKTSTMMVGGGTGDDIPIVEEDAGESTEVASADTGDETSEGGEGEAAEGGDSEASAEAEATPTPQPKVEVDPPDAEAMQAAIQSQIQQGLYVKDGAAYSVYYFNQNACKIYTDALNKAAEKLAGQANVYSILVPNQSGAMLPEDELKSLGGSDQTQAIQYYYSLYDNEDTINHIMEEFGLTLGDSHIINGHVPVEVTKGETPIKCGGKLLVIDGGFSKAYQEKTGIAGYTLVANSHGMFLISHQPFESKEIAVRTETDIVCDRIPVEIAPHRIRVADTDVGKELKDSIIQLEKLLEAYREGIILEK